MMVILHTFPRRHKPVVQVLRATPDSETNLRKIVRTPTGQVVEGALPELINASGSISEDLNCLVQTAFELGRTYERRLTNDPNKVRKYL